MHLFWNSRHTKKLSAEKKNVHEHTTHLKKTRKHNRFNIVHFHPQVRWISRFVCGKTVFAAKEAGLMRSRCLSLRLEGQALQSRTNATGMRTVSSVVVEVTFAVAAGLHVGAQFVHAVERVQEERAYGVDLHQSQVVQLRRKRSRGGVCQWHLCIVSSWRHNCLGGVKKRKTGKRR